VPTLRDDREPLKCSIRVVVCGEHVPLRAYRLRRYGSAPLYFLEPALPKHEWITKRLYGGGSEHRIAQEMLLGIGGIRLLRSLDLEVDVYHFNEGHAVFAGHELLRQQRDAGATFEEGLAAIRPHIVFTTHTPVAAGNELHEIPLLQRMGADVGLTRDEMLSLGGSPYSMTTAGLHMARAANAVAELHGHTARQMWQGVENGAPITSVTNGVHLRTWQDARVRAASAPDKPLERRRTELWAAHQRMKNELIDEIDQSTGVRLRADRLMIGFARRAASYKRAELIFGDPLRLDRMLADNRLQLVFAGKAHPHDRKGKQVVANLVEESRRRPEQIVFLPNYDMRLGALMTRGCDMWLNNPRRPMEASGTSGMKAAMNGALNISILDGWWPEGCVHGKTGWQIGSGEDDGDLDRETVDDRDREALYSVLATEVMPLYYEERERWLDMMIASIEMSQWRFSAERMIEDYYRLLYNPAPQ